MQAVDVKMNPKVVVKQLRGQVGILNTKTTELFMLDELASRVVMCFTQEADMPQSGKLSPEDEAVVDYLLDAKILVTS